MRVAVAVSGGADSVALLCALAREPGLVLSVVHVHHGIRGAEADGDADFVAALTERFALPFARHDADTPEFARRERQSLEEAARTLRYQCFDRLLGEGECDAVATAHTLDDQAETVLHKLLRGAWTEGLGGIAPVLQRTHGVVLRPLLATRRAEVVAYLATLGQAWREDSSNLDLAFTRNRIRHNLLPELAGYNPQVAVQLAHVAELARDEETFWQAELVRLLPSLLAPGRPVRGGGRATSTVRGERMLGMELERLRSLHPALARRVVRAAARELGVTLDFDQTARLLAVASSAGPRRAALSAELQAERTPRELRLTYSAGVARPALEEYELPIPGEVEGFGLRLRTAAPGPGPAPLPSATLRAARPDDRVQLRHASGPKKIKEVLERMGVAAADRAGWPVVEWQGEIVWMRGAALEAAPTQMTVTAEPLADGRDLSA